MTITQHGVFCLGWFLSNGSCCINNDCVLDDASRVLWNRARMNKHRKLWETLPKGPRLARRAAVNHLRKHIKVKIYMHTSTPTTDYTYYTRHTSADTQWLHILEHTRALLGLLWRQFLGLWNIPQMPMAKDVSCSDVIAFRRAWQWAGIVI